MSWFRGRGLCVVWSNPNYHFRYKLKPQLLIFLCNVKPLQIILHSMMSTYAYNIEPNPHDNIKKIKKIQADILLLLWDGVTMYIVIHTTLLLNWPFLSFCVFSGSVDSPVDWPGLPGGLYGVPEGQWHRRPWSHEGNGLSRGPQPAGNLWRRTIPLLQQRHAERGTNYQIISQMFNNLKLLIHPLKGKLLILNNYISNWTISPFLPNTELLLYLKQTNTTRFAWYRVFYFISIRPIGPFWPNTELLLYLKQINKSLFAWYRVTINIWYYV